MIVFVCLFSLLSAIIFYKGYKDMRYQQQISDMNFEMLKRQYETIQKMYTEKRTMLHDSVHQDVLILECELIEQHGPVGIGKATAWVDGVRAANAELTFVLTDA